MRPGFHNLPNVELRRMRDVALSHLEKASTYENKSGYLCIRFENHPELKQALDDLGFFFMHSTNKGHVAGVHQIVLFLHKGFWRVRYRPDRCKAAKGQVEVHHLDSNRKNNDKLNLVYVTPQQNSLCANAVHHIYDGKLTTPKIKSWSKFGGGLHDTAKLIRLTLVRTIQAGGFCLNQIPSVINILMQLPAELGRKLIKHWQFDFKSKVA
jgi:hypothetical protein